MLFLKMARQLKLAVISMAADGAASELGAQNMMDHEQSDLPPLVYDYPRYGIHLRAPVFDITGPLISVQDPLHARKTCRNQPQHGTHTCSLGRGVVVNRSLLQLYETGCAGLQLRDVQDVDKQDDGAARRLFHHMALLAMTFENDDGHLEVRAEFRGLYPYIWVFGTYDFMFIYSGYARSLRIYLQQSCSMHGHTHACLPLTVLKRLCEPDSSFISAGHTYSIWRSNSPTSTASPAHLFHQPASIS